MPDIRILTSCTGQKQHSPAGELTQADFRHLHDPAAFTQREGELARYRLPAAEMYTGMQHVRLMEGIAAFEKSAGEGQVDLWIVSAGYGLIPAAREIVPYECTFQEMKLTEVDAWAEHLGLPTAARTLFARPADLVVVLLGTKYLRALALDRRVRFGAPTLFFAAGSSRRYIQGQGRLQIVELGKAEATRFSCGLVGLKGEVARRLLLRLAAEGDTLPERLFNTDTDVLALLDRIPE